MNINLTPILQAFILLIASLITYRLIPWIKANTNKKQQEQIEAATRIAVFAAEQVYGAAHGQEKLDYAIQWLHSNGFDVSRTEIEAAVYEFLNSPVLSLEEVKLLPEGKTTPEE